MRRLFVAAFFAVLTATAFALPTVDDVQAEVNKGHYAQAEEMMREVVAARPGSARAHYVYAEILAHDRRFELAAEQAAQARRLDPAIKFTQPEKFSAFEQLLDREQAAARRAAAPALRAERQPPLVAPPALSEPALARSGGGVPGWVWALGLMAVAFVVWRVVSSRQQALAGARAGYPGAGLPATASGAVYNTPGGPGYAPGYGYGQPGMGAGAGSGLLGTGLAVAGGVAAGMLAEKLLDGRHEQGLSAPTAAPGLGGMAPGLLGNADDDPAARELEDRPVDFGSGDGWGSGDDNGGGGGSSGSDDGGW